MRAPSDGTPSASSLDSQVAQTIANEQPEYQKTLMMLYSVDTSFGPFSNTAYLENQPNSYNSLEGLHNIIHNTLGSGGHMTYPSYAGFDPVFWLHHANVDRTFAIWQALYPDEWIQSSSATSGSYTVTPGDVLDENTPLAPFHKDTNSNYYTSKDVRNISAFGYSYPELQWWNHPDPDDYQSSVKSGVNTLYNQAGLTVSRSRRKGKRSGEPYAIAEVDGTHTEWIVNIRVQKHALPGSFDIYIFLGDYNAQDSTTWPTCSHMVGKQSIFADTNANNNGMIVTGVVPFTDALEKYIQAGDVDGSNIVATERYLRENLNWGIRLVKLVPPST